MSNVRNIPAVLTSVAVHALLLGAFALIRFNLIDSSPQAIVHTVFSEERVVEQFTQELQLDATPSESLNLTAGGVQATHLGGATSPSVAKTRIDQSETLNQPQVRFHIADMEAPGLDVLGVDLGE
ncbi:MAG: VWA domain-containing protein, partial [Planctomycetaceae bacterium]|nr:VWA domain-containing protein [Planctomycetaceae bacterium]